MFRSWSSGQAAALVAAASIPSGGYAWLEYYYRFKSALNTFQKNVDAGITFLDIFEKHALERPSHPCILYEEEMYTYAEVAWNTNRLARWVRGSEPDLKKGDVVCVLLHNGPTFVWTWLGLMKLGVISSLINFNLKGAALVHCIRLSNSKQVIVGSGNKVDHLNFSLKCIIIQFIMSH